MAPYWQKHANPLLIILGAFHPAYRHSHRFLLADEPEGLADLIEAYLGQVSLYFSLVGVMATEFALSDMPEDDTTDFWPDLLAAISRGSWFLLAITCLTGVAGAIHLIWTVHTVPLVQRRRFILDHELCFSIVYAVAPLTFVVLFVALITGGLSLALSAPIIVRASIIIAIALGVIVAATEVYTSGKIMEAAFRPWDLADRELQGRVSSKKGTIFAAPPEEDGCPQLHAFLQNLDLLGCEVGFREAGLTLPLLLKVAKELKSPAFLDSALRSAGVTKAGSRLEIILGINDIINNR